MPDKELNDLETSWQVWTLMEATGWKFLPYAGGLLDQPQWLIDDLFAIADASQRIERQEDE